MTDFGRVMVAIVALGGCIGGSSPAVGPGDAAADQGPTQGDGGARGLLMIVSAAHLDGGADQDAETSNELDATIAPVDAETPTIAPVDAETANELDATIAPLVCEAGFYDCDGTSSNGCEWDGCAMVIYLNLTACGMCGGVEVCGCGPSVMNRVPCDIDCDGKGAGAP